MADDQRRVNRRRVRPVDTNPRALPPPLTLYRAYSIAFLLLNLAATSHAQHALLSPIYGKTFGPMFFHFGSFVAYALCAIFMTESKTRQRRALQLMSVLQVATSVFARAGGAYATTRISDPTFAALAAHSVLSFPVLGLGGAVFLQWVNEHMESEPTAMGQLVMKTCSCVALATVVSTADSLVRNLLFGVLSYPPQSTLVLLGVLSFVLSIGFSPDSRASRTETLTQLTAVTAVYFAVLFSISSKPAVGPAWLGRSIQAFTTHGLVQVSELNLTGPPILYLRQDATIVGVAEIVGNNKPADPNSPVYRMSAADALTDAVRLVQGQKGKQALVIGVKTGANTKRLVASGYNTTIVEAERSIYDAANAFFQTPEPAALCIDDPARCLAFTVPNTLSPGIKYDVIIHSVFNRGELPASLFTVNFWDTVKGVIDERGVLAVHFVGKPGSLIFKSVLNMLQKAFTTCRAYHSGPLDVSPLSKPEQITDIVIFCTPSSTLDFRKADPADYARAIVQEDILTTLASREVSIPEVLGDLPADRLLLKNGDEKAKSWGKENINEYWKLMREWFPAELWATY